MVICGAATPQMSVSPQNVLLLSAINEGLMPGAVLCGATEKGTNAYVPMLVDFYGG